MIIHLLKKKKLLFVQHKLFRRYAAMQNHEWIEFLSQDSLGDHIGLLIGQLHDSIDTHLNEVRKMWISLIGGEKLKVWFYTRDRVTSV